MSREQALPLPEPRARTKSPVQVALDLASRKPLGAAATVVILVFGLLSLAAPVIAPFDPLELNVGAPVSPPSAQYLFGTDPLGRDMFSRILWGGRISIAVALLSVVIGKLIGTTLGVLSAFYQGTWIDRAIMWITDVLLAMPVLVLAMAVVAVIGPSLGNVVGAIAITLIPSAVRVIRSQALTVLRNQYVDGARAIGATDMRVMFFHVLPNCMAPFIIIISGSLGTAILAESSLSFLGLGVPPPTPTWGGMLSGQGRLYMTTAMWLALAPGLCITVLILAFNILGDALRDTLDPRLRQG